MDATDRTPRPSPPGTPAAPEASWGVEQDRLYDEALTALEAAGWDMAGIGPAHRGLVALWRLESDLANGGFLQLFGAWGMHLPLIEATLAEVGAHRTLQHVQAMYEVIAPYGELDAPVTPTDLPALLTAPELARIAWHERALDPFPDPVPELVVRHYAPAVARTLGRLPTP